MILYLDASALVKLYVDEEGASQVREATLAAAVVATSEIAYVELRAAMARRQREGALTKTDYRRVLHDVESDWLRFFLIAVDSELVSEAGAAAERYRLRAYDALHLTSGLVLQARSGEKITFACWDRVLQEAASTARLHVIPDFG